MWSDRFLVSWAYLSEIVLVAAVYVICTLAIQPDGIARFLLETSDAWVSTIGGLLGAAVTILIAVFVNVLFTDFGEYLQERGAGETYVWAFATPVLVFFATLVTLIVAGWAKRWELAHIAFLLLLYSIVNGITMTKNTVELATLFMTFKKHNKRG